MLSLRSIWRGADLHFPTLVTPLARSFGTEVPQDDAMHWPWHPTGCFPLCSRTISGSRIALQFHVSRPLAKHRPHSIPPALVNAHNYPLDFRREIVQTKCLLQDARAALVPPETTMTVPVTIRGRENIRSAGTLPGNGAGRRVTSNPNPAAAGGYLRRPSVPPQPACPRMWPSARRSWRGRKRRTRAPG